MVPATLSGGRPPLYLAALLFGAATALYSIVWRYYDPPAAATRIGAEFTYSLASHALRVTRVLPRQNAEQAGLRPEDEILAINNAKLDTLTLRYPGMNSFASRESCHCSLGRITPIRAECQASRGRRHQRRMQQR